MLSLLIAMAAGFQQPNCADPQSQHDMNQCAAREANEADADLNMIWREVLAHYQRADGGAGSAEGVKRLRAAQRAWIAFRDAECAVAGYEALGGSLEPMLVSGCNAELTRRRAAELRQLLTGR